MTLSVRHRADARSARPAASRTPRTALRDETFLVISGDALTDIDLDRHARVPPATAARSSRSASSAVPDPLEFGIVIPTRTARIERFLEKPTWGQVFSDTVNTGIYVMEPEVLDRGRRRTRRWTGPATSSPSCSPRARRVRLLADGYWEDVGTLESYLQAQADVLNRQVDVEIDGFECRPGVWVAEGAEVDPDGELEGPAPRRRLRQGRGAARSCASTPSSASNVVVKAGAFVRPGGRARQRLHRAAGEPARLRHRQATPTSCAAARVEEGAVIGDECVVEEEAFLSAGVKVYPFKTDRGRRGRQHQRDLGVARPAQPVRPARRVAGWSTSRSRRSSPCGCASAYATTLQQGQRRHRLPRRLARRARAQARRRSARSPPAPSTSATWRSRRLPVTRFATAHSDAVGGIMIRTTPGDPQSVDIVFLDEHGADLSQAGQRKLERVFSRQEFRRAFPGEIAELSYPARFVDNYTPGAAAPHRHAAASREAGLQGRHRHRGRRGRARAADAARPARRRRR